MDLTPLIDIVFLQLIFFMLTSSFVFQPGVQIQLPKAVTADINHQDTLIITVAKDRTLFWGEEKVSLKGLKKRLRPYANTKRSILLRADKQAPLENVIGVWDLCRELGITRVNIATGASQ